MYKPCDQKQCIGTSPKICTGAAPVTNTGSAVDAQVEGTQEVNISRKPGIGITVHRGNCEALGSGQQKNEGYL